MRARGNFDFFLRIYRLAVEIEMMFARGEAEKYLSIGFCRHFRHECDDKSACGREMKIISASPSENLESDKLFGRCGLYSLRLQLALNESVVALDKCCLLPCRKIIIFIENVFIGYPRIENFLIAEACYEEIAPVGERGIIGKFPCVKGRYPFAVGTERRTSSAKSCGLSPRKPCVRMAKLLVPFFKNGVISSTS